MMHNDRREQWKFDGREVIDGVPHLTWKCEAVQVEGKGRHRADVPEWRGGLRRGGLQGSHRRRRALRCAPTVSCSGCSAHMDPMTDPIPAPKTFADFLNAESLSAPRGPQLHRITWFIDNGFVSFEMECLHEEMAARFVCDKESAEEDRSWFIECFEGGKAPLRDGVIESWWDGSGEDSELSWKYINEPVLLETIPGPEEKLLLELHALEEHLAASLSEHSKSYAASAAYEDTIRRVRELLARHTQPADTTEADARSTAALADEISYCLNFRPATALAEGTPAAQKVARLSTWLHTDGWRRTGPVRPLESITS